VTRFTEYEDERDYTELGSEHNVVALTSANALVWTVKPNSGRAAWRMDLSPFAVGDPRTGIRARPSLVKQLAPAIRAGTYGKNCHEGAQTKTTMKYLWRMLDSLEIAGAGTVEDLAAITNAHGQLFKTHLLRTFQFRANYARGVLGRIRRWFVHARDLAGFEADLIWPTITEDRGTEHKDVDPRLLRPLYHHLKRVHFGFLGALEDGPRLAARGVDPRSAPGSKFEVWNSTENWAYFAREFVAAGLSRGALPMRKFAGRPVPDRKIPHQPGPSFLDSGVRTHFDAVRWFVPTMEDAVAAFTLVMLHTGWNPDTVKNIDISEDSKWFDHRLDGSGDPQSKTATVALYAFKGRTGREQIAFSLRRPKAHPFQIIRSMVTATEPLRAQLRKEIEELGSIRNRTEEQQRRFDDIRVMVRSPWLYFTVHEAIGGSRVAAIEKSTANVVLRSHFRAAIKSNSRMMQSFELQEVEAFVERFSFSDIRDGFASFIYDNSMSNILLLKAALGHSRLRVTRAYLRQRRQIAQRFERFTHFQETIFDEIRNFQRIDPTILYVRMSGTAVTEAMVRRLRDARYRTRMGMGCVDPENPPRELSPDHRGGPCVVQRCTLCVHGVVFEDSLPDLAVRVAELRFIRSQVAAERFEGSTFQAEWLALNLIVERLFPHRATEFERAAFSHGEKLARDEVYLFDQVPPSALTESVTA
jgi:hypothetical protein